MAPFFGQSDWAVILDRTEPNYLEAVHGLNEGYSTRKSDFALELD